MWSVTERLWISTIRIKKIGMIVDEWGCWFTVEPGTNPGFLYQQNTVRDALVAGITLNIFNKHCDRVKMAKSCTDGKCIAVCHSHRRIKDD